ncbi:hypothetical protein CRYUN_Cryun33cG0013700 [Craigia yunnanensis]
MIIISNNDHVAFINIPASSGLPRGNALMSLDRTIAGNCCCLMISGYREKVFAVIGVKAYAAGLYVNQSFLSKLGAWKVRSAALIQDDLSLFNSISDVPLEKSLQIVLVRDVDGKTFGDALDEAISPRINAPTPVDESALSSFHSIFQGRPLNKGTFSFSLGRIRPKCLLPSHQIDSPLVLMLHFESTNVASALFDVCFWRCSSFSSIENLSCQWAGRSSQVNTMS